MKFGLIVLASLLSVSVSWSKEVIDLSPKNECQFEIVAGDQGEIKEVVTTSSLMLLPMGDLATAKSYFSTKTRLSAAIYSGPEGKIFASIDGGCMGTSTGAIAITEDKSNFSPGGRVRVLQYSGPICLTDAQTLKMTYTIASVEFSCKPL